MGSDGVPAWAGFWARLGAFLADTIVLGVAGYLIGLAAFDQLAALGDMARLIGLVLALAYFGLLGSSLGRGRTLGMRLLKLRIVGRDGEAPGLAPSLGRALVLVTPIILNGMMFRLDGSVAAAVLGAIAVTGVVGVGLAQIYLLLFNRPSRRLLHDLIFGTSVIPVGGPPPATPAPTAVSNAAFGVVAAVFVLAIALPGLIGGWMPKTIDALVKPQLAVQALPEVISAGVTDNTTHFYPAGKPPTVTRTLVVSARLRTWPSNSSAEITRIGKVASANYRLEPGQQMQIRLIHGFDLGIASGSTSYSSSYDSSPR